ncbi:MAG: hypothetical protein J4445_00480 [DPANN group archaeon]|nr:hypothetical protein [DPANN group archaeon]
MNKSGVIRPILVIGMIVIAVIFIVFGVQVFLPLFKTLPEYVAFDQKLTVETLLAAPETAQQDIIHKEKFIGGTGSITRKQTCAVAPSEVAISLTRDSACFNLIYMSEENINFKDIAIHQKVTLVKEYDETTRKSTFRGVN